MTNETKDFICNQLKKYKEDRNMTYKSLASEISQFTGKPISYATVCNIILKKLKNDKGEDILGEKLMRQIKAFLRLDDWTLIETHNMAAITELCEEAHQNGRFFGIAGSSQFGKTESLQNYCANNANSYYVLSTILMTSKTGLLKAIQGAMGISKGTLAPDMLNAIVEKLLAHKSVLIIDDAGKLSDTSLRLIQLIRDRANQSGLIVAGTPYLKLMLENGITRNRMGFEELFRRIEYWLKLADPTGPEIAEICVANGLDPVQHKSVIRYIINNCNNFKAVQSKVKLALRLKDENRLTETTLANTIALSHNNAIEDATEKRSAA